MNTISLGGGAHCHFLHPARGRALQCPPPPGGRPRQTLPIQSFNFVKMEIAGDPPGISGQRPLRSGNDVFRRRAPIPSITLHFSPQEPSPTPKERAQEILHARGELLNRMLSSFPARSRKFKGLTDKGVPSDERHLSRFFAKSDVQTCIRPASFESENMLPSAGVPFALRSFPKDEGIRALRSQYFAPSFPCLSSSHPLFCK